ncbi:hypothetical protein [Paenibacillus sp. 598K]|uniref:hypothetical protein n=1 Tax=Paenibacillus sp. 598K TaxID=1117987 RepID=UPI0021AAA3BD|nr:hypothetical protein [Paenibacillus sp. 598K]
MLYYAEPAVSDELHAGWIGGNAPAFFDEPSDLIHDSDLTYLFYLTLVHPFQAERMISIFIPEDYEAYLKNNIYPNCSIKVVEHPISTESAKATYTSTGLNKHHITAGESSTDDQSMDQPFLIKAGGTPRLIQKEAYYFTKLQ